MGCYSACPRGTMTNLTGVIRKLRKERQRVHGEMERLNAALAALGSLGRPYDRVPARFLREGDVETVGPEILGAARAFLAGG